MMTYFEIVFKKRWLCAVMMVLVIAINMPQKVFAACLGDTESKIRYSFSVVPQLPPSKIYQNWSPVLTMVGLAMEVCFELKVEDNIPEFEANLMSGRYDFAYMNPYHAYLSKDILGFDPVIVDATRKLKGIIVVSANSDMQTIQDLEGKTVAFPAPNAFGASLLIRGYLENQNIKITPVYRETHSNVYRQTARGFSDAGGGVNNTLLREPKELRNALRILFTTEGYVSHPIGVSASIGKRTRQKFIKEIIDMTKTQEGRGMLEKIQIPAPRSSNFTQDFQILENLNLEKFRAVIGER